MADVNYLDASYCASCDEYFVDKRARAEHIDGSLNHPKCTICAQRFLNMHVLRNHYTLSSHHHYCRICDKLLNSAGALEVHINYYHGCDDSDSDDEADYDSREDGWEDDEAEELYPNGFPEDELKDVGDYVSYEDDDSYDFEDIEDLEDPPFEFEADSDTEEEDDNGGDDEERDEESENTAHRFACPMCEKKHEVHQHAICTTPCGHMFCAPCITSAYKYTQMCPICDERGELDQLRRIYISEQ